MAEEKTPARSLGHSYGSVRERPFFGQFSSTTSIHLGVVVVAVMLRCRRRPPGLDSVSASFSMLIGGDLGRVFE